MGPASKRKLTLVDVFYDGFNYFPPQGVGRYFANLISRLPEDVRPEIAVTNLVRGQMPVNPNLSVRFGYTIPSLRAYLRFPVLRRLVEVQLRRQVDLETFDIIHPTYYEMLASASLDGFAGRLVITVYDMIHERFPEIDPGGATARRKAQAVTEADRVLCISENTRRDLLSFHPEVGAKATVTPLASDLSRDMCFGPELVPDAPYLLYVGGRSPYKNFDAALNLIRDLAGRYPELTLAVAGPALSREEKRNIQSLGIAHRIRIFDRPSDEHLAKLYRCSAALVYPTRYEGFGIPPLEAMSCGTPVVASRSSSIPEVVGDAGILVDPDDPSELRSAVVSLLDDGATRNEFIARGFARAAEFDWNRTAKLTVDVYRDLVRSRG